MTDLIIGILETTVPVFAVMAVGYIVGGWTSINFRTLAVLAMVVTSPALVFDKLSTMPFSGERWGLLAGGVVAVAATTAAATWLTGRRGLQLRALLLPTVFWNAGNMGLPIAHLAFGDEGLQAATIVFVCIVLLQSSFGISIAKGSGGFFEILRQPLFHASVLGVIVAAAEIEVTPMVAEPIGMIGDMAIPLMLLNLGIQLRILEGSRWRPAILSTAIRMGVGILAAILYVNLLDCSGADRSVLLLSGVLPPAVINVVFAQKYDTAPGQVASSIVLGTLVSLITIPTLLAVLRLMES